MAESTSGEVVSAENAVQTTENGAVQGEAGDQAAEVYTQTISGYNSDMICQHNDS
jgi:hypothetical protein